MMADGKLSPKHEAFARAYVGNARFVASEAARIVGYTEKYGCDIRKNPEVSARIDELLLEGTLSPKEVLAELTDVGRAEWRDFITIRTNPKTGEVIEVRMDLGSKVKSLELLGKAYGLFTDRVEEVGSGVRREYIVIRDGVTAEVQG